MPVRIRITLIFTLLVAFVLTLVCVSVYYFSYTLRVNNIESRLISRAITIGNLLGQSDFFTNKMVRRIDSLTYLSYTNKIIQAYDDKNNKIYEYKDQPKSFISIAPELLNQARVNKEVFFKIGQREAVAYNYAGKD